MEERDRLLKLEELCEGLDEQVRELCLPMVADIVFLEQRLSDLRRMPFIEVHPTNPAKQRATAAAKQYKELLQQYNNCIKIMLSAAKASEGEEMSPLREYLLSMKENQS